MNRNDIKTVALGLHEARPGSYPNGGPDTDDGWRMWNAAVYTVEQAVASVTRGWAGETQRLFHALTETGKEP